MEMSRIKGFLFGTFAPTLNNYCYCNYKRLKAIHEMKLRHHQMQFVPLYNLQLVTTFQTIRILYQSPINLCSFNYSYVIIS
jgi:hypothetical protein